MKRALLVDLSGRGGIAQHTDLTASALLEEGLTAEVLGSRVMVQTNQSYPVWRWLPATPWARGELRLSGGKPEAMGASFYARRLALWLRASMATELATRMRRPGVIDFQAPFIPRLDARLVRRLRRLAPVVWTAHDVLPFERSPADVQRYTEIYQAVDRVIVHSQGAAEEMREMASVDPVVLGLIPPEGFDRVERATARTKLNLPPDGRILGAFGFIRSYKGYDLLADTWERLGPRAPTLLVMGEVVEDAENEVLERLRRTGKSILRLDYAGEDELRLAYSAVDAVLLPHIQASNSGLLTMAITMGTPVIASDAPALAAAVGDAGVVVPRSAELWANAVTGELPPAAPSTRSRGELASARISAYEGARAAWGGGSSGHTPRSASERSERHVVAYTDARETGGAELSLANLLADLRGDLRVTVLCVDREVGERIAARRPGTNVVVVPPVQGKWDLAPIGAHLRAVRRLSPDIFHANLRIPWACQYGIAAALAVRVGAVIAVEQLITPAASRSQRKLKLLTSGLLDAHVAVGAGLAREIETEVGLPRGTIRTIHNSVEDRPMGSRSTAAGPTVGTLARLAPEKRLDLLVRALATLPDVRLVIVGDGAERESIERLAESLGVADRLEITGWLRDARSRLPEFDVFALPSDYEGFPHAVLEAMLAGLPVVATDVGSVREAVIDGTTGIIVAPGDAEALSAAIGALLSDPDRARRMGEAGRTLVLDRFMPQTMVAAYEALYDEVTS